MSVNDHDLMVFWCFQGVEKGCIGNKWVNALIKQHRYSNKRRHLKPLDVETVTSKSSIKENLWTISKNSLGNTYVGVPFHTVEFCKIFQSTLFNEIFRDAAPE